MSQVNAFIITLCILFSSLGFSSENLSVSKKWTVQAVEVTILESKSNEDPQSVGIGTYCAFRIEDELEANVSRRGRHTPPLSRSDSKLVSIPAYNKENLAANVININKPENRFLIHPKDIFACSVRVGVDGYGITDSGSLGSHAEALKNQDVKATRDITVEDESVRVKFRLIKPQ